MILNFIVIILKYYSVPLNTSALISTPVTNIVPRHFVRRTTVKFIKPRSPRLSKQTNFDAFFENDSLPTVSSMHTHCRSSQS